jgi:hypothetical protein
MAPTCVLPFCPGPAAPLGGPQEFEAAGHDFGNTQAGYVDNFAIGNVEIEAGHMVVFEDTFDNDLNGPPPTNPPNCNNGAYEAVYIDTLVIGGGATVTVNNTRLYYITKSPPNAMITLQGCGEAIQVPLGDVPAVSGAWLVVLVASGGLAIALRFRAKPGGSQQFRGLSESEC